MGSADLAAPDIHDAVIWEDGQIQDLGTVDGDACSRGIGLNARGQVVVSTPVISARLIWEEGGPALDLNKLIAPGSGWQLTNAFNINDRGEILAKAAPVGFTPNDDEDLGHLVLLIPCEEHDSSCGGSAEATASLPARTSTPSMNRTTRTDSSPRPRTPQENVGAWRARFAKQYRVPGVGTRKD